QDAGWAAIRIDVIGVRIGPKNSSRTPEITHLQGIG
ncbi:MAG: YraN family protein, partial [Mycobacterium sp.]